MAEAPREKRQEEAREALRAVSREPASIFSSALSRASDHLAAKDADPQDGVELWGRRIGRGLSVIAFIVLAGLVGRQLHLW